MKKRTLLIIGAAVIVLAVLLCIGCLALGALAPPPTATPGTAIEEPPATPEIVMEEPTATPEPATEELTATPIPAGATEWLTYEGKQVGVREIAWSYRLEHYRPESGKIFLSLYIIGINAGDSEETFSPHNFSLVDGGGEISGQLLIEPKEPEFSPCTVKPGGMCEGWWTTAIWDRPDVKENLMFRWDPGFWSEPLEVPIQQ